MSMFTSVLAVSSITVLLSGCAPPARPSATATSVQSPEPKSNALPAPKPAPAVERATIEVAQSIREACGLSDTAAYFAYDSSSLISGGESLAQLAGCFTNGPLAGRRITLVGHADPRGDDDYNMQLGERRAGTVNDALVARNLRRVQISASSRGEMDATGHDEAGWAHDRRVQIDLVD